MRTYLTAILAFTLVPLMCGQPSGGAGVCHTQGDPDNTVSMQTRNLRYQCALAFDEDAKKVYYYDKDETIGSRWKELPTGGGAASAVEWDSILNVPGGFADGIDNVDDADADPNNEIQQLSISTSGDTIFLTQGGNVVLQYFGGDWSDLTGVPSTFPPDAHTHTEADITDLTHFTGADITGNEAAFNGWDKDTTDDFSGDYLDLDFTGTAGLADGVDNVDDADNDPTNELYDDQEVFDSIGVHRTEINNLKDGGGGGGVPALNSNQIAYGAPDSTMTSSDSLTFDGSTLNLTDAKINISENQAFQQAGNDVFKVYKGSGSASSYENTLAGRSAGAFIDLRRQTAFGYFSGSGTSGDYQALFGAEAGRSASGDRLTAVGDAAGYNCDANSCTVIGYFAGRNNTANNLTTLGYYAGYGNSGTNVTAVGWEAARDNNVNDVTVVGVSAGNDNTGIAQTAVGVAAGNLNDGTYQTAVGRTAGQVNAGNYQAAYGYFAGLNNGADYQTTIGAHSGRNNTAVGHTAVGYFAGYSNTGINNTSIGYRAGDDNTGDRSTFVGYGTGDGNTWDDVQLFGVDLMADTSNQVRLGSETTKFLKAGNSNISVEDTPTDGQIYKYDAATETFLLVDPQIEGTSDPTGTVVPEHVGQHFYNTVTRDLYYAPAINSNAWIQLN